MIISIIIIIIIIIISKKGVTEDLECGSEDYTISCRLLCDT